VGLPPKTTAADLELTDETKELAFDVKTDKASPAGKYKNVFCQVTITQPGGQIVSRAVSTELQIDKPLPEATATLALQDPDIAVLNGNLLKPLGDGRTELIVTYAGHEVRVPVVVRQPHSDPPIGFRRDVMPVFLKAGCNTGSCHGSARGQDGFRLSLFGFDPEGDYYRLTREVSGRRINLAEPGRSLLIEKALGKVPHTGGTRFDTESAYYAALIRWLDSGAPNDPGDVPAVTSVDIYPPSGVLSGPGATQQLIVRAHYADGSDRDITWLSRFTSSNSASATVSPSGLVTPAARGEAFVMARFDTHTVGTHLIVLPKDLDFQWLDVDESNPIDALVNAKLRKLRIQPSALCSDAEFLRRATLDITGALPTRAEYDHFVASEEPGKRAALVDRLLAKKEFVDLWVMQWAELLQIRTTQRVTYKPMLLFYTWLQEQIASNVPVDQMVRQLLASQGGTFANPATNYYQNETDTLKTAENVAQALLGMRIQCTQCHNHPFDRWTMDDYYSFAAFFAQIGRKPAEDPREQVIFNKGSGVVRHPVDKRQMEPKFLGGPRPDVKGKDRRALLAVWLTAPDNPYFARHLVNLVWAHFFGRGIVEPVDDVRVSNPPVNPELLAMLAQRLTERGYDFKQLVRTICTSQTYQLSWQTNSTNAPDTTNFSHAQLRRLRAEVLLDVISQVTETEDKFRGLPLGARATQIADGNTSNYFLTTFGRAKRQTVCTCEVVMEPNLSQALHLLNGNTLQTKIRQGKVVERLLAESKTPQQVIEDLYLRCLTRPPTEEELSGLTAIVAKEKDPRQALEDTFWALLNSREFLFNH
jgi:hypothetical protein